MGGWSGPTCSKELQMYKNGLVLFQFVNFIWLLIRIEEWVGVLWEILTVQGFRNPLKILDDPLLRIGLAEIPTDSVREVCRRVIFFSFLFFFFFRRRVITNTKHRNRLFRDICGIESLFP